VTLLTVFPTITGVLLDKGEEFNMPVGVPLLERDGTPFGTVLMSALGTQF
jgi:hypothetical protein